MADSFHKKENNKKKVLKKKMKDRKREERKTDNNKGKGFDSMLVYVDENGHLTDTPPEPKIPAKDDKKANPPRPFPARATPQK